MAVNLKHRSQQAEIMDDLESGGPVMDQTLKELEVINKWLGGNYVTLNGIKKLISENTSPLKIVDVGCGGGDMLKLIANWARKNKIKVELIGVDANPHVISFAEKNTSSYPEISFEAINIFSDEFARLEADIFISTLFTHHFSEEELVTLLKQMQSQSRLGIVINDIHRHWLAYYSIKFLTSVFSRSSMVRNDAALSVARAFHKDEWLKILKKANIATFTIGWYWAFRWQLVVRS